VATTLSLESELRELGDAIRRIDAEAAEKHEAADTIVADYKEKGVNPLLDKEAFDTVDAAYKEADELREQASTLRQRRETVMERMGKDSPSRQAERRAERQYGSALEGVTEKFMATPEYQRMRESGAFEGKGARIELPKIEVMSRDEALRLLSAGSLQAATADIASIVVDDFRRDFIVPIPVRMVKLLDLIQISTTDSDQVDYVEETTRTDAAAETAPGTAAPEASYVYTNKQAPVRDIVHFTPAHRRNLADAGQARALLEGRLQNGVERRLESQLVSGDGSGENLRGVLNTSGIASVARGTDPRIEAIHKGITQVRLNGFVEPDALLLHPSDYEEAIFEKDANGAYLLGPASQQESRTVWGFPTVVSTVIAANTSLVGQFRQGAVLWLRSGVSLSASDSHSTFFTERRVALMAELRAAFAAWQPKLFAQVTGM
jgi:HK97 family phage major capsid protein